MGMITNKRKYQIYKAVEEYFNHSYDEVHPKPIDVSDRCTDNEEEGFTMNQARIIFQEGAVWATEHPSPPFFVRVKDERPPYIIECPDINTSEKATLCIIWSLGSIDTLVGFAAPEYKEFDGKTLPVLTEDMKGYSLAWYDINGHYIKEVCEDEYYMVIPKFDVKK